MGPFMMRFQWGMPQVGGQFKPKIETWALTSVHHGHHGKRTGSLHLWWAQQNPLRPHAENHRLNASRWQERKSSSGGSGASGGTETLQAGEVGEGKDSTGFSSEETPISVGGSLARTIKIKTSCQKFHPVTQGNILSMGANQCHVPADMTCWGQSVTLWYFLPRVPIPHLTWGQITQTQIEDILQNNRPILFKNTMVMKDKDRMSSCSSLKGIKRHNLKQPVILAWIPGQKKHLLCL